MNWFTNYGEYHNLRHCMAGDNLWMSVVLTLSAIIAIGYLVIALKWLASERKSEDAKEKDALRDLRIIFSLCAFCGYVWPWLELLWPAWRLQACVLAVLAVYTSRYALSPVSINVVYEAFAHRRDLVAKLTAAQEQIQRLRKKMKERDNGPGNQK